MNEYHLTAPLKQSDIKKLRIGDTVYLSGKAFTCRSKLQRAVFDEGIKLPENLLENDILIHVGPVIRKREGRYKLISFMPTSSVRFEKWGALSIEKWGLKVIVGKTTMGDETAKAMQRFGCVHLSPRSVSPNLWVDSIEIEGVDLFDEMGSIEAPWQLSINELGPFVVDMDTQGGRLFEVLDKEVERNLDKAYKDLGIPEDFKYTKLY
jgi:tartrate/fumarate subfamily iron-sulfur-dependent hydro-lyase beta chain